MGYLGQEIIACVERIVPEEVKGAAMKAIGAGLYHLIHNAAGTPAKFRAVVVGKDLEFRNRIRIWIDNRVVAQEIIVVHAIHQERQ